MRQIRACGRRRRYPAAFAGERGRDRWDESDCWIRGEAEPGADAGVSRNAGQDSGAGEPGGEEVWELDWGEYSGESRDVPSDVDLEAGVRGAWGGDR